MPGAHRETAAGADADGRGVILSGEIAVVALQGRTPSGRRPTAPPTTHGHRRGGSRGCGSGARRRGTAVGRKPRFPAAPTTWSQTLNLTESRHVRASQAASDSRSRAERLRPALSPAGRSAPEPLRSPHCSRALRSSHPVLDVHCLAPHTAVRARGGRRNGPGSPPPGTGPGPPPHRPRSAGAATTGLTAPAGHRGPPCGRPPARSGSSPSFGSPGGAGRTPAIRTGCAAA
jgi:hypothetical protein